MGQPFSRGLTPGHEQCPGMEFSLQDFKVFYVKLHELEEKGCSETEIEKWIATLEEDKSGFLDVNEVLTVEPLAGSARFVGIEDEQQVQALFYTIKDPKFEDEICRSIRFMDLAEWITT